MKSKRLKTRRFFPELFYGIYYFFLRSKYNTSFFNPSILYIRILGRNTQDNNVIWMFFGKI